jgi:hypothetical protein
MVVLKINKPQLLPGRILLQDTSKVMIQEPLGHLLGIFCRRMKDKNVIRRKNSIGG